MRIEQPRIPIRDVLLYGLWPGFIKVMIYRLQGYRIGKGVSIGFGSVICAKRVEIGDHAHRRHARRPTAVEPCRRRRSTRTARSRGE